MKDPGVNYESDVVFGKVKLLNLPEIYIGIKKGKLIWDEKREPQQTVGGQKVASEDKRKIWKAGYTTADSFKSVWKKTKLQRFFEKQLKSDYEIFATIWAETLGKGKAERARLNTASAIMKKAYFKMAKLYTASAGRAIIKGHKLFAIGTAQTLKAIEAWTGGKK